MLLFIAYSTVLVIIAVLSLWFKKDPKIWGSCLFLSFFFQAVSINVLAKDYIFIILTVILWILYKKKENFTLFSAICLTTIIYKLIYAPGFFNFYLGHGYMIRFESALTGIFPLALSVELAKTKDDWIEAGKALIIGFIFMVLIALLVTVTGNTLWEIKIQNHILARIFSNLFLSSIPEEGFYRGFLQAKVTDYLKNFKYHGAISIFITSIIYMIVHSYGEYNIKLCLLLFFVSVIFGYVYHISNKIEASILCHFLSVILHSLFFRDHPI